MRILVTGGMGFIGNATINLLKKNHKVVSYDIQAGEDILDPNRLDVAFRELRPEVVFHLAAQVLVLESFNSPSSYAVSNILGTVAVAEQCKKWGAKIIYASSGGAIYGSRKGLFDEEYLPQPFSPYGISKYTGELFVKSIVQNHVILRYANVYGPGQFCKGESIVVANFLEKMIKGDKPIIRGNGLQTRDYVYIDDVVEANLMALGWEGTYNIGTGKATSVIEIYGILADLMDYKGGYEFAGSKGEIEHTSLSCAKANSLGWKDRVSLKNGLISTAEWAKQVYNND